MARSNRKKKSRNRQSSSKGSRSTPSPRAPKNKAVMVFSRQNYLLMLLGIVLVVVGYIIMRMENEVDGFISLYVAPLLILGGYLEIIYAILKRPKDASANASSSTTSAKEATDAEVKDAAPESV